MKKYKHNFSRLTMEEYERVRFNNKCSLFDNYWNTQDFVALLYLIVDHREVEHDGYCSDPGDDVGEWEYNVPKIYKLNQDGKDYLAKESDRYGTVKLEHLQQSLELETQCQGGSGYCNYYNETKIHSGRIISREYISNWRDKSNIETIAYYIAEKDKFTQGPETYWKLALLSMENIDRLATQLYIALDKAERRKILQNALEAEGMILRRDSKLCRLWIDGCCRRPVEEIVQTMAECKWCIEYHDLFQKIQEFDTESVRNKELFSFFKAEILKNNPLPAPYPWKE